MDNGSEALNKNYDFPPTWLQRNWYVLSIIGVAICIIILLGCVLFTIQSSNAASMLSTVPAQSVTSQTPHLLDPTPTSVSPITSGSITTSVAAHPFRSPSFSVPFVTSPNAPNLISPVVPISVAPSPAPNAPSSISNPTAPIPSQPSSFGSQIKLGATQCLTAASSVVGTPIVFGPCVWFPFLE